ncbi:MAG TPA: M67 family metallopeptidase [Anaerolineaceae bacterium]|nr:M67 family metallopeptidase [Anaerolineaceae bacterium]
MAQSISLSASDLRTIIDHARSVLPEEACGFVAGQGRTARAILPVTNRLHSQVRFEMEPQQQFKAMLWIEENGLEILAIYHSHPGGPGVPSQTDIAEFYFPEALCLIVSPVGSEWQARAFQIDQDRFEELTVINRVNNSVSGG